MTEQCCERDDDRDGNCDVHSAPGVFRNAALNVLPSSKRACSHLEMRRDADVWYCVEPDCKFEIRPFKTKAPIDPVYHQQLIDALVFISTKRSDLGELAGVHAARALCRPRPSEEPTARICDCRASDKGCEQQPNRICAVDHYHRTATEQPSTMCKHDDGDCHQDDPCDFCPVYTSPMKT